MVVANAEAHHCNEQQIQHHIDPRGDHQVIQRMLGIAHGLQNTHGHVIEHHRQRTGKIHPEIGDGLGQYRLRRAHPAKQLRR